MISNNAQQNYVYDPLNILKNIGTRLSHFQEIQVFDKYYTLLGKGCFGYTEKMKSKINGLFYAIKKLAINQNFDANSFYRETEIMVKLQHENIVKFYGYFEDIEKINKYKDIYQDKPNIQYENQDKHILCLVMEYVPNGTLENYYKNHMKQFEKTNNFKPIEQKFIIKIFKQVLNALVYLESQSIMHRDIKPDNLLFDQNFQIKIADFGISALCADKNNNNNNNNNLDPKLLSQGTRVGPRRFVSPEIEKNEEYDYRTDIYSFGLTMLCLMSRHYPITLINNPNPNQSLKNVDIHHIDNSYNIYLRKLVLRMIEKDKNKRPYAMQAYEELCFIEEYINNPNNEQNKKFVIRLEDIGNKLSDFEEIPNDGKNYFLLGKGNFGYAEKMKSKLNNSIYAIKKLVKDSEKFNEKDFFRETQIMMGLYNENIVRLYGYFEDKENINKYKDIYSNNQTIQNETQDKKIYCLVLEYAANGSLDGYYKRHMNNCKNNFTPIQQDFIIKILKQLLYALTYLGYKSIMHRDIKLDNILLDEYNNIKISDFGISALYYDNNPLNKNKDQKLISNFTQVGRKDFVSPEIEKGQIYDFRVDIYSLGLSMLCLISRIYPISLNNNQNQNQGLKNININYIDNSYNFYLKKLILRMINNNIKSRPFAKEAFEEINYIEKIIKNPNDQNAKQYLDKINGIANNQINQNNQVQNPLQTVFPGQNNFRRQNSGFQNPNMLNNPISLPYYKENSIMMSQVNIPNQQIHPIGNNLSAVNNPIPLRSKNTSLIRVLQCLYFATQSHFQSTHFTMNYFLKGNKYYYYSYQILQFLENLGNNCFTNNFNNLVEQFRQQLSQIIDKFKGNDEIEPKWVFYYIFKIFNDDFANNNLAWQNNLINESTEINLPQNYLKYIKECITAFKNKYRNTFVDNFYFILLTITQCKNCYNIIDIKCNNSYFIELPANCYASISELINNYIFSPNSNGNYYCTYCCSNVYGVKIKSFLNSPKYLILDFADRPKEKKKFDNEIDLTSFIKTDKGPRRYSLYALICIDNEGKFVAYIKYNENWLFYSEVNNSQNCSACQIESLNNYSPYFAIYKGI